MAIIPDDRLANWMGNVGVPGGIPVRETIFCDLTQAPYNADNTGVSDCSAILTQAIYDCPNDQVIWLPAGTYLIESAVDTVFQDRFSLRGEGMGQTIIKYSGLSSTYFVFGRSQFPPPNADHEVLAGMEKGSTEITVADASAFYVGFFVGIAPEKPVWVKNLLGDGGEDYRTLRVACMVTGKTATTVEFEPPLPWDFTGMDPYAQAYYGEPGHEVLNGIGIEDLTLDLSTSPSAVSMVMERAYGCWIKGVEVTGANQRQIRFTQAVNCEVRQCYVNGTRSSGPNHEGITFDGDCYWNLIEDNIFYNGGAPPVIFGDSQGSAAGNVVAYNVAINTWGGFWDMSANHNPHNFLNLFEGNFINSYKDDGYFGSSSHQTLLRNRIRSQIALKHFSNYYNIVGNVLGSLVEIFNTDGTSQPANNAYSTEVYNYYPPIWPIYELGYPNIGNTGYTGAITATTPPNYDAVGNLIATAQELDYNVKTTIIQHGNWDVINDDIVWDPGIADHDIPESYFLSSEPAYFTAAGCPWPPFDPNYPDRGMTSIPAGVRLQAIIDGQSTLTCTTLNVTTFTIG